MIELRQWQWDKIFKLIRNEYKDQPSVYLMRSKMRNVLGFVYRNHSQWVEHTNESRGYFKERVYVDFYHDAAESMFRLKYADIMLQENKHGL